MAVFPALLKREWQEQRSGFIWAPAILLALMLMFGMTISLAGDNMQVQISTQGETAVAGSGPDTGRGVVDENTSPVDMLLNLGATSDRELAYKISQFFGLLSAPFYWLLIAVSLYTLIACLYDERKDQSILFWKSMPVGNLSTVLSKLVFVTWVAPLVTILAIILARALALLLAGGILGDESVSRLWAQSGVLLGAPGLLLGFVLHGFWIMPIYAWFLLMATTLPRAPLLWAVGGPLIVVILERIFLHSRLLWDWIMQHAAPLALPGVSSNQLAYDLVGDFQPFAILSLSGFWVGLLVAAGLLAATVYMRGYNNEL